MESIALGTPVVAFDCQSGPREIVENDINGYLAEYQNIDDLASKIRLSLQKKWDYESVADTAQRFNLDSVIDQYESLLM